MINQDTICAISTAPGVGGIAVIRVSGPKAIEICDSIFRPFRNGKPLSERKAYTMAFGNIIEGDQSVDEVMMAIFRAPHSFTAEDTIEISCHGSLYIQQQILQLLIKCGCRLALPGEFTQRAFLNGKMDLSQAEAVADLIASTSAATHKLAMTQMRGGFSQQLRDLRMQLLNLTSLVELELDFSEEEVEFADREQLRTLALTINDLISKLTSSFNVGNAIKNGIPVAIIGETNAGKSTLLNVLLKEERAIVSDIHGTTRDVIEDSINIGGITFRFIDTAGIRDTHDVIESMGIDLAYRKIEQASIVLWMIDSTQPIAKIEEVAAKIMPKITHQRLVLVFNKVDKLQQQCELEGISYEESLASLTGILPGMDRLFISAKEQINTTQLEELLVKCAGIPEIGSNDVIVTNARHYEALTKALAAIDRVRDGLDANISGDFLSQDIRECMHYLGEITGEISNDDILGNIFENFCIGK